MHRCHERLPSMTTYASKWDPLHKCDLYDDVQSHHTQTTKAYYHDPDDDPAVQVKINKTHIPDHWPSDLTDYELFASERKVMADADDTLELEDTIDGTVTNCKPRGRHVILEVPGNDAAILNSPLHQP